MTPSNILPPSNQVTRSLRQTTQETPLPADTLPRLGKVSPHALSKLSSIDDIPQMHHLQPFDLLSLNCLHSRSTNPSFIMGIDSPLIVLRWISPHNPKSHNYDLLPTHRALF
ncbi:hypothetical protein K443DRAFT_3993 [Laccaria amethystina LaAM-08-1]|uniref:Uncharacterized protein n=1 Tax=Laccaria amethystina LaAM-08-1 TaxID=1095629 RepID=A0A0C9XJX5_9AGAR|nr:hypothetical protein K443DRAFT_3993 [Laccaria amethystina LaAM-08-1]